MKHLKIKISEDSLKTYASEANADKAAFALIDRGHGGPRFITSRAKSGRWFVTFFVTNHDHIAWLLGSGHKVVA